MLDYWYITSTFLTVFVDSFDGLFGLLVYTQHFESMFFDSFDGLLIVKLTTCGFLLDPLASASAQASGSTFVLVHGWSRCLCSNGGQPENI